MGLWMSCLVYTYCYKCLSCYWRAHNYQYLYQLLLFAIILSPFECEVYYFISYRSRTVSSINSLLHFSLFYVHQKHIFSQYLFDHNNEGGCWSGISRLGQGSRTPLVLVNRTTSDPARVSWNWFASWFGYSLRRIPFMPQLSPFTWAWTGICQQCILLPNGWVHYSIQILIWYSRVLDLPVVDQWLNIIGTVKHFLHDCHCGVMVAMESVG